MRQSREREVRFGKVYVLIASFSFERHGLAEIQQSRVLRILAVLVVHLDSGLDKPEKNAL